MSVEVRVPVLGESVTEATVATWFKKPGDAVTADEVLCELETDKVSVEVAAPSAGTLGAIVAAEGATVGLDALLTTVENGAAASPVAAAPSATPAAPTHPAAAPATEGAGGQTVPVMVPELGESVTEATVATWFKTIGETVAADEILCELETDKVSVEVASPSAGTLADIKAATGATVARGAVLAAVAPAAGASASLTSSAAAPAPASNAAPAETIKHAPSAEKAMAEAGLTPDQVTGTGRNGRIMKDDVTRALDLAKTVPTGAAAVPASARPASAPDDAAREKRVKMTRLRRTIARRLKDAQNTAAMLTTYNEVDMTAVMELRKEFKDLFEKKHGVKLGFMSFFVKACCHALNEIPAVNAEIDGEDVVYKNYAHIGVAVGTPQGLVVPVVRNAHTMSFAMIEQTIAELGKRARDGKLSMGDMQGGTFTISNGGVYGSLMSSPILNPPQSGILGMHKIQERPMVVGGQIVARPMMYLALSYDHRIIDGKEAVTFLVRVKESLEDPRRLLMDL
ncbi:MAG: 2-oxoglutarate dehydrogenase complex dihydrolipoyllysine-residue succinyltransferase [Pseudomonadota bacterium]